MLQALAADIGALVKGGRARLLAVSGATRDPAFPDVRQVGPGDPRFRIQAVARPPQATERLHEDARTPRGKRAARGTQRGIVGRMATRAGSATNAVLALARERPEIGVVRASRELRKRGVRLSPSGVRLIWARHDLATAYQRLMLRKREADKGRPALSESQRATLERMRVSRRLVHRAGGGPDSAATLRRERLLAAAARVLDEKGYEGASLRDVCAAAGILPGSLYYHFKSKEDLFIQLHAAGFRQLNDAVDKALSGEVDPWRRLEAACAAHLALLVGSEETSLVSGTSLFRTAPQDLQRRLNRDRIAYEERYRTMIADLGLAESVDQTLLRLALFGALNWTRIWYQPGKQTPQEIAHHLVQRVLRHGLDARGVADPRKAGTQRGAALTVG